MNVSRIFEVALSSMMYSYQAYTCTSFFCRSFLDFGPVHTASVVTIDTWLSSRIPSLEEDLSRKVACVRLSLVDWEGNICGHPHTYPLSSELDLQSTAVMCNAHSDPIGKAT